MSKTREDSTDAMRNLRPFVLASLLLTASTCAAGPCEKILGSIRNLFTGSSRPRAQRLTEDFLFDPTPVSQQSFAKRNITGRELATRWLQNEAKLNYELAKSNGGPYPNMGLIKADLTDIEFLESVGDWPSLTNRQIFALLQLHRVLLYIHFFAQNWPPSQEAPPETLELSDFRSNFRYVRAADLDL